MIQKINAYFSPREAYGAIFIRLIIGLHLIYGVQDNVRDWDRMLEFRSFLEANHFPFPLISAVISVYAQLICGFLFIVGAYVRVAALIMICNFLAALTVHTNDPYPVVFPALMMLCSSLFLLFHGPGKLSFDERKT
jgi:putative oxidoreductase